MAGPYRGVVADLDGTLLRRDHTISTYTAETLQLLMQKGIPVVFATGRPHPAALHTVDSCGLHGGYVITSNGARVNDPQRRVITAHDLDPAVVTELMQLQLPALEGEPPEKSAFSTNMYRHDEWVTSHGVERMLAAYAASGFHYKEVKDIHNYPNDGVHEIFYVGPHET
ncbi:haloacid dehalogenase-like hydrolase, partial [Trypanosoma grayi]|uniref:haloacid dehalogenase-like hydrolase n=1 Tax=Trypanosoma grayi TaxID=71804 RepID=UPI0004F404AE